MLHFRLTERNLTRVIPNGVDTEIFRPSHTEKVQDILFVGRFQKVKGLDILLSSLKYLFLSERRKYKVGVIGPFSPDQRAVLTRNVPEELREEIEFHGTVPHEDMPQFLNSSRLVVMPSRYETFGLPALEGIACGIPVVASNVGGLPEIVNKEVGLLFEAGDSVALAKAISKGMSEEMADAAMRNGPTMAKRFDWRVICAQLAGALSYLIVRYFALVLSDNIFRRIRYHEVLNERSTRHLAPSRGSSSAFDCCIPGTGPKTFLPAHS